MRTIKHSQKSRTPEQLFEQAVAAIPYDLTPTSITQGTLDVEPHDDIEYSEEFTFPVGRLFDEELTAGGWIELRRDQGEFTITAFFGVSRNGDWDNGRILPDDTAVQGCYDLEKNAWEFWIDRY